MCTIRPQKLRLAPIFGLFIENDMQTSLPLLKKGVGEGGWLNSGITSCVLYDPKKSAKLRCSWRTTCRPSYLLQEGKGLHLSLLNFGQRKRGVPFDFVLAYVQIIAHLLGPKTKFGHF